MIPSKEAKVGAIPIIALVIMRHKFHMFPPFKSILIVCSPCSSVSMLDVVGLAQPQRFIKVPKMGNISPSDKVKSLVAGRPPRIVLASQGAKVEGRTSMGGAYRTQTLLSDLLSFPMSRFILRHSTMEYFP